MANYFNKIRKSGTVHTIFSLLLSNFIAFGQPAIMLMERHSADEMPTGISGTNASAIMNEPQLSHMAQPVAFYKPPIIFHGPENKTVFHAKEYAGSIGKSFASDIEDPADNFFSIDLPGNIDGEKYDAILVYDIYGVSGAASTTKSINNSHSYGGRFVSVLNEWTTVKEFVSITQFNEGENIIFFNRRSDENYKYKVRNLRIELTQKIGDIVPASAIEVNDSGRVYFVGTVAEGIDELKAGDVVIPVRNGIFEYVLADVPADSKEINIKYASADGTIHTKQFPVQYKQLGAELDFGTSSFTGAGKTFWAGNATPDCMEFDGILHIAFDDESWKSVDARVIAEGLKFKDVKPLDTDLNNVTAGTYPGYRIKIENFLDTVRGQVHLRYDPAKIPEGYTERDVKTYYFDKDHLSWKALPVDSLDIENSEIISTIYNNDTDYINGVIKVPESPETGSFTPTMINDIKYADPAAGIVSVPPPTPNNMGSATTSFPLKLPQGRNGMQPNLQVTYNSEGGNGILGMGWAIQTSAITVNTKWGAPRFDPNIESESYSLDGEDLLLEEVVNGVTIYTAPHKHPVDIQRQENREFFLRKEGGYQKIKRWGDGPQNYWWEITDKLGNRTTYGGIPGGTTFDAASVIRTTTVPTSRIAHWAIKRVQDPYGNYMDYSYARENNVSNTPIVNNTAKRFTLSNISYSRYQDVSHYYKIDFIRSKTTSTGNYTTPRNDNSRPTNALPNRKDVSINARNGYFEIIDELLTEVIVWMVTGPGTSDLQRVRVYRFDYYPEEESPFQKSLLKAISEYDSSRVLFYSNSFEYFNETDSGALIPSTSVNFGQAYNDAVTSKLSEIAGSVIPGFPNGSPLGTSTSSGFSFGLRGGFGIGSNVFSINGTAGASASYSKVTQDTKISFIDLNGDGLPDKVYKGSGGIFYRPQTTTGFGNEIPVSGIDDLSRTKSNTTSAGVDARIGISSAVGIGKGKGWSWTRSETDNYFTDFNGDGLPDIVAGSRVHFNITKPEHNPLYRHFDATPDPEDNENPIMAGAVSGDLAQYLHLPTMDEIREEHSQFDHVKVWRAPYGGHISISGEAKLIAQNTDPLDPSNTNTFRLTIEKGKLSDNYADVIAEKNLSAPDQTTTFGTVTALDDIEVEKGEYFFFRIHNEVYGYGGEIEWNPVIEYFDDEDQDYTDNDVVVPNVTLIDDNGKNLKVFSAAQDFIMNNDDGLTATSQDTTVKVKFGLPAFSAHQFSDDITFTIKKVKLNSDGEEIIGQGQELPQFFICSSNTGTAAVNGEINIPVNATGGDSYVFYFYATSSSNVDWSSINWKPQFYTNTKGWQYAPVNYRTFDENVRGLKHWFNTSALQDPDITDSSQNNHPFMILSHNFFNDSAGFLNPLNELEDDEFPVEVNWVTKVDWGTHVQKYYSRKFYVDRDGITIGIGQYSFYNDAGMQDPLTQDEMGDTYMFSHSRLMFDKGTVQNIIDNSGKIYSAFYVSNRRAGLANIDIRLRLVDSEQGNYPSFNSTKLDSPFFAQTPTFMGLTYRNWGQFLYNGGLAFERDEEGEIENLNSPINYGNLRENGEKGIEIDVFDVDNQQAAYNSISADSNPDNLEMTAGNSCVRYTFYKQNNELNEYSNESIVNRMDGENSVPAWYGVNNGVPTARVGRFGEPSIYALWLDPDNVFSTPQAGGAYPAFKQRSKSKGKSKTGELSLGSGTESEASSQVLNQYIDLNGDRYPDLITSGKIQYTNMHGGLSTTKTNSFASTDLSKDFTFGISLPSLRPNSTESNKGNAVGNKTNTNISSGVNTSTGTSFDSTQWSDMNGDGLVDKISLKDNKVRVQLNTGYDFMPEVVWVDAANLSISNLTTSVRSNHSVSLSNGSEFNPTASFALGLGASQSTANMQTLIADVTGDGLPELVIQSGGIYKYYLNTGTGFETVSRVLYNNNELERDYSVSANVFASVTWGIPIPTPIPFLTFKITFSPSASGNASINEKRASLQDLDGDGFVDVVKKGTNSSNTMVRVSYNKIGKTNLLKQVNLPLGGHWKIDYTPSTHSYNMPQFKWLLTKIETNDGFSADNDFRPDVTETTASYQLPNHDRREREFLGFALVFTLQNEPGGANFRSVAKIYHNENIYLKGAEKASSVYSGEQQLSSTKTLYNLLDPDDPQVNMQADADGHYLQEGLSESLLDHSRLFVAVAKVSSTTYEGTESLTAEKEFAAYDEYGNLEKYIDYGEGGEDAYTTNIKYYGPGEVGALQNATGFPKLIKVSRNSDSAILRQRSVTYNTLGKQEVITTSLSAADEDEVNRVGFQYDSYGNVLKVTQMDNLNALGSPFEINLEYDTTVKMFPVKVTNSFNEFSTAVYNYLFGVPVFTTDVNGQSMRTRIDKRGRVIEVTGPNELALEYANGNTNMWTIRMFHKGETDFSGIDGATYYNPISAYGSFQATVPGATPLTNAQHFALTRHFDSEYASTSGGTSTNHIFTVCIADGLGQPIQVKKTHVSTDPGTGATTTKWLTSGFERKDAFGRTLESFLPTIHNTPYPTNMGSTGVNTTATAPSEFLLYYAASLGALESQATMEYDAKDRVTKVTQRDETASSQIQYSIEANMLVQTVTNEKGQTNKIFTDVRGRQRKTVQNDEITTRMNYNAINELVSVVDNENFVTSSKYDMAGRKVQMNHPDRGVVTFKYDNAGRMTEQSNSNLIANGNQKIEYTYDFGRLIKIEYPNNEQNNIEYTYGAVDDPLAEAEKAVGRLLKQKDATGIQVFGYGRMGEVTKNLRSVVVGGYTTYWFLTQWKYDSWNRVQEITYPDKEVVSYTYNKAGMLQRISSTGMNGIAGPLQDVVKDIQYNNFGERVKMEHGNGKVTTYSYDSRRRMNQIGHTFTDFAITKKYSYDALSNITEITTSSPETSLALAGGIGGPMHHEYEYDDYNRLEHAEGYYTGPKNSSSAPYVYHTYELDMQYNTDHTIKRKKQQHYRGYKTSYGADPDVMEPVHKTSYELGYENYGTSPNVVTVGTDSYGYQIPHAPRQIMESPSWVAGIDTQDPRVRQKLIKYDANGNQLEISEKVGEETTVLRKNLWDEENRLMAVDLKPDDKNPHPIAIYTYDAGGERTIRYNYDRSDAYSNGGKVGGGVKDNVMLYPSGLLMGKAYHVIEGPRRTDFIAYTKHYYAGSERLSAKTGTMEQLGLYPEATLTTVMPELTTAYVGQNTEAAVKAPVEAAQAKITTIYTGFGQAAAVPPMTAHANAFMVSTASHNSTKLNYYYFHPDHLGSSSYVTNGAGKVIQHMEYLPFGEALVDEHSNSFNSPFKYNGKNFDEETGNYYYSARYYDPKWSIFISVDPLAEKYPSVNPYAYCFNNPIILVDPTGMEPNVAEGEEPPKTNIIIRIDDGTKLLDETWSTDAWHHITAKNLTDANKKLKAYLGNTKADNIFIDTHGFAQPDSEQHNILTSKNGGLFSEDFSDYNKTNIESDEFKRNINREDVKKILDLASNIKDGGNFIISACTTGNDKTIGANLSSLLKNKVNLFLPNGFCVIPYYDEKNGVVDTRGIFIRPLTVQNNGWSKYSAGEGLRTHVKSIELMSKNKAKPIIIR